MRISDWSSDVCSSDLTIFDLISSYGQIRARARPAKHIVARRPGMTLEEARERVGRLVGVSMDWTILESFLPEGTNPALRKSALASSFVAALELARQGRVNIRQIGRASCRERVCQYV